MKKFIVSTDIEKTVDEMIEWLVKNKSTVKKNVLRQANNPRYRINPATETIEFEFEININKIRK